MNKNVPNAASTSGTEFSYLRRAKITFACATLLGCTWIFGLVAIGDLTDVFQWLFTILNSLQGFFIFVFYTVTNPQIQKAWLNCFTRTGTKKSPSSNMIVKTESTSQVSKIKGNAAFIKAGLHLSIKSFKICTERCQCNIFSFNLVAFIRLIVA